MNAYTVPGSSKGPTVPVRVAGGAPTKKYGRGWIDQEGQEGQHDSWAGHLGHLLELLNKQALG